MKILQTERLILREFTSHDAGFVLELLNTPAWLQFIGDRGVRNLNDAQQYIQNKFISSYQTLGFGLYLIERKPNGVPIGACGLIKREYLEDVDIGFALLPEYINQGYAFEASSAVLNYARSLKFPRLVAITMVNNTSSIHLLTKLGLTFERMIKVPLEDEELKLFKIDFT
ncbi:MAG TPA: GNAT family N-acetyltransferase [Ohtaekwangia sp.]